MKILCDVCGGAEATVFCNADEAALCAACDRRVHRANKLAGKHFRFSLLSSASGCADGGQPLCDICQEKRGFVFCKEDRAILCPDCDLTIHQANRLTIKHGRFILAGIRLSAAANSPPNLDDSSAAEESAAAVGTAGGRICAAQISTPAAAEPVMTGGGAGGSSISEYLTKMLPGYCVEDFLADDPVVAAGDPFCENDELLPFMEACLAGAGMEPDASPPATEAFDRGFPIWAPHVPEIPPLPPPVRGGGGGVWRKGIGEADHLLSEAATAASAPEPAPGRKQWNEDGFTVPEMPPAVGGNKRARCSANWYF